MRGILIATILSCAIISIGVVARTTAAPTPAQKCLSKKLKEVGKYDLCRLKAEAKGVLRGTSPDFSRCLTKITQKWTNIESAGGCDFPGDQTPPQALTDTHADDIFLLLSNGALPVCGDGAVDAGEVCDSANLDGETCISLGYTSGTLACDGSCAFDTSGCVLLGCGNANVDPGEQCDGVDLNGFECGDFGFSENVGTLGCTGVCEFDTSSCVNLCGNGVIDGVAFESCDGADLNGQDCTIFGGTGGTLACTTDCFFDPSGCVATCGDGVQGANEDCDGLDLGFNDCSNLEFVGGTLACTVGCEYDTSACTATCGDNVTSAGAGEECDGTDTPSDCTQLFYHSGSVSCTAGCTLDESGCVLECDYIDQDCPGGDGCYFDFGGGGGGCQPAGTSGPYESCVAQSDCAPKHFCSTTGGSASAVCVPFCDSSIGDADCPAGFGFSCFGFALPTEPDFGICLTL